MFFKNLITRVVVTKLTIQWEDSQPLGLNFLQWNKEECGPKRFVIYIYVNK